MRDVKIRNADFTTGSSLSKPLSIVDSVAMHDGQLTKVAQFESKFCVS